MPRIFYMFFLLKKKHLMNIWAHMNNTLTNEEYTSMNNSPNK